ncbi:MAG TPA: L,D-transpeptidase family protein [Flavisolibacter sp.]
MSGKVVMIMLYLSLLVLLLTTGFAARGQHSIREGLEKFRKQEAYASLAALYGHSGHSYIWFRDANHRSEFLEVLSYAEAWALDPRQYNIAALQELQARPLRESVDSINAELAFSISALRFFSALHAGNTTPGFRYDGLKYAPSVKNIPLWLFHYQLEGGMKQLAAVVQPRSAIYRDMMNRMAHFHRVSSDVNFNEVKVVSGKVTAANRPLMVKLYQLGIAAAVESSITDKEVAALLRKAQRMLDVLADGTLRSISLAALNKPLAYRRQQLSIAINHLRWMEQAKEQYVAIVNIPAAQLYIYKQQQQVFESRMVVGKKSTPTPVLASTIREVVLYPYWMVPHSIATRELLPAIRRNIRYLASNNYTVLNSAGRIVNPYSIDWHALGPSYFPYTIRQGTGCDNALGIVKFNFTNPFNVYLHDTPSKGLFALNKRYFSHGCMRVEKAVDLGRMLLGINRIAIDTLEEKGCQDYQKPVALRPQQQLPVMVIYSTAWYTATGDIVFYDDIYGRMTKRPR